MSFLKKLSKFIYKSHKIDKIKTNFQLIKPFRMLNLIIAPGYVRSYKKPNGRPMESSDAKLSLES